MLNKISLLRWTLVKRQANSFVVLDVRREKFENEIFLVKMLSNFDKFISQISKLNIKYKNLQIFYKWQPFNKPKSIKIDLAHPMVASRKTLYTDTYLFTANAYSVLALVCAPTLVPIAVSEK